MNPTRFNQLVRECVKEVLLEGRRICAWCKTDMGSYGGGTETSDTHGICPNCLKKMDADLEKMKQNMVAENPPN